MASIQTPLVQELSEDDFDRRVQFCDLIMEIINDDPLFLDNIFSLMRPHLS